MEPITVALFGASSRGLQCLDALRGDARFRVVGFFDNDPTKWGTSFAGLPIWPATQEALERPQAILVSSMHVRDIFNQLVRLGVGGKAVVGPAHLVGRFFSTAEGAALGQPAELSAPEDWERTVERQTGDAARRYFAARAARPTPPSRFPAAAAFTICSNNYIASAEVLAQSFLLHHPRGRFFVVLADRRDLHAEYPDHRDARVTLIEADQLRIPDFPDLAFKYTILELNTAVKPFAFEYLLRREGLDSILYLDPDILVLEPLDEIYARLADHPILVTPHITTPYADQHSPGEVDLLKSGVFNLGFLGVAAGAVATRFLAWWQGRLRDHCTTDVSKGEFVDQKWIDLAPALFPEYDVLRAPGFNVAYWNLHERELDFDGVRFRANGEPLVFFHFSGFDPAHPEDFSKYQTRFTLPAEGPLRLICDLYRCLLSRAGHFRRRHLHYAYDCFENGVGISPTLRRVYRSTAGNGRREDPFSTGPGSFYEWLNSRVSPESPLTNLAMGIHGVIDELRHAYPDPAGHDRDSLLLHLLTAAELFGLAPQFCRHLDAHAAVA